MEFSAYHGGSLKTRTSKEILAIHADQSGMEAGEEKTISGEVTVKFLENLHRYFSCVNSTVLTSTLLDEPNY